MSDDITSRREELAGAFDRDLDPLKQYADRFERVDIDPFELFIEEVLAPTGPRPSTVTSYERTIETWREHMAQEGRHPACPNEGNVRSWIRLMVDERGYKPRTVQKRLNNLKRVYGYWQDDSAFPHPHDFNPVASAREKEVLESPSDKDFPRLSVDDLRLVVGGIDHVQDQAIIVPQLKLGLRRSELVNIELGDVAIDNSDLREHFPSLGSNPALDGRRDAIYIPSRYERAGNKSKRPRLLPLDGEARRVLLRYLLIRPDDGGAAVFSARNSEGKMGTQRVNETWEAHFHPEYAESEDHRGINSHFGRHFFTTYWRVQRDLNRELIKYMRGDTTGQGANAARWTAREAIDDYIHPYFEDIEQTYREEIFDLRV